MWLQIVHALGSLTLLSLTSSGKRLKLQQTGHGCEPNCFQPRDTLGIPVRVTQSESRYTSVITETMCHQIITVQTNPRFNTRKETRTSSEVATDRDVTGTQTVERQCVVDKQHMTSDTKVCPYTLKNNEEREFLKDLTIHSLQCVRPGGNQWASCPPPSLSF